MVALLILLEYFQTFTREGVSSVREMEWLDAIGGIDRVLAHILAQNTPVEILDDDVRQYARSNLAMWNEERTVPDYLARYQVALKSIFDDFGSYR